jgi:RNA polymerase sigma factor (sigma-70 family)
LPISNRRLERRADARSIGNRQLEIGNPKTKPLPSAKNSPSAPSLQWSLMTDRDRLARVVCERAGALVLYARQWLPDAASAEDAVQEAMTALLAQPRPPDDPVAWMFRAVRNAAIDQARATSGRRRRERAVAGGRREWFEPGTDALLDARAAERALRQLSADAREIVVLRIWSGLGFAQIARVTGLGVSTVHDRYTAALEQLRHALEKPCPTTTTTNPAD